MAHEPVMARLREQIDRIQGGVSRQRQVLGFGLRELDDRLPAKGLELGALHEVAGGGNGAIDGAAASLFVAGIAARTTGKVLWCLTRADLFAPAIAQVGLAADRVIYVEAGDDKTVLACAEEGLRHGGLGAVVGEIARLSMAASGFDARAAVADTWGVAHGLARFGSSRIVIAEAGAGEAVIASLPLGALRLPLKIVTGFRTLGFDTIGDLLRQPRAPLVLRFGPELGRRLDQALGQVREPIDPIRLPDIVEVRLAFAEPIGAAETIARYVGKLVGDLCTQLEARGLGVRHLDLICERVDSRAGRTRHSARRAACHRSRPLP